MGHVPHELNEEFAGQEAQLQALKGADGHLAHQAERYHEVNHRIHKAETDLDPLDDAALHKLKSERLHLKDQIAAALRATV